jgi:hypothetical protein
MNWEAIGAIGEIVGAIAVVITVGYLAVQIRQNTRTVRASTHHGITREWNELNVAFGADPAVSSLLLRGSEDYLQLDHDERFRYTLLMRAAVGTYNDAFLQFREHLISGEVWATYRPVLAAILGSSGARVWWERNRQLYPEAFQEEISRFLAAKDR